MGKAEDDEFSLSSTAAVAEGANAGRRESRFCRCIRFKCLFVLLLGISVFLSAIFWLPPFRKLADRGDPDLDPRFRGHTIVASFTLPKPASIVKVNTTDLLSDIYYDLEAANTTVNVLSLESSTGRNGSNATDIVFVVDPVSKHSSISPAALSLIRELFGYLVTEQMGLQVRALFGKPSFFEVLKFPGGITISPTQYAYPLQKVQINFNFTLNNSIRQIQDNFLDLKYQLASGLHLTGNENLYIRLTNSRGSTVAPPATVQTSVVLRVGVPSVPRLKQLAQTIRDSPARNLGLNNTVFGKVKQISLSSVLQHSLNGDASSPAPAPSPLPHLHHHHHHHHHHHDHRHHEGHKAYLPPVGAPSYSPLEAPPRPVKGALPPRRSAPSPTTMRSHRAPPVGAPTPVKSYHVNPPLAHAPVNSHHARPPLAHAPVNSHHTSPPGCRFGFKHKHISESPAQPPTGVPHHSIISPHRRAKPPTPIAHRISPSSPLPNVIYARVPPPAGIEVDPEPPDTMPLIAPSQSVGGRISATHWVISLLVVLILDLW